MTDDITPERQAYIDELLGAAIVDPDPKRTALACDDCNTKTLAAYDTLLTVEHDASCPTYRAMSGEERIQHEDGVTVVHVARVETTDG